VALALAGLMTVPSTADDVSGYLEFSAARSDTTTELANTPPVESRTDYWVGRGKLEWLRRLWPNLSLRVGGFFEKGGTDFASLLAESTTTRRKTRPYFELRLRSDEHRAEVRYEWNENWNDFGGVEPLVDVRERFTAAYGWFAERKPQVQLQYFHVKDYDRERELDDRVEDRWLLITEYEPVNSLYLRYRGSLTDTVDRIDDFEVRSTIHSGRIRYSQNWWEQRVLFSGDYSITRRETETLSSGSGEIPISVFPVAGLSSIDDLPEKDPLPPNPLLIDGNVVASAGLNLGLPAPGEEDRPRNLGLDFAIERDVNTLLVWIDRELPPGISDAFSWRIYTSIDNDNWTLHAALPAAPFGPFENRFELRFPDAFTRYIKVVVSPLTLDVPFATDWPLILITELQAELRRPSMEAEGTRTDTSQVGSLDLRARLLRDVALYYEFSSYFAEADRQPSLFTVSNGVSISYPFPHNWTVNARVAHEDGRERGGDRTAIVYSASLIVAPIELLRHSIVVSGKDETYAALPSDFVSMFFYTTAELYRGVSLIFGAGKSYTRGQVGDRTESDQLNVTATLVPNERLTFVLTWRDNDDVISRDGVPDDIEIINRQTLYFFGSWRVEDRTGEPYRIIDNYALNWSPFPNGTLRFRIAYNESTRSDDDYVQRALTPSVRWTITRRSWLDLAYQKLTTEQIGLSTDTALLSGTLRINF